MTNDECVREKQFGDKCCGSCLHEEVERCVAELPPGKWRCVYPPGHGGKHFNDEQNEFWDEFDLAQEEEANQRVRDAMGKDSTDIGWFE